MAKTTGIINRELSGSLGDLTFVNSKAYEPHLRRKRGTVKEAVLNTAMVESKNRLLHVNQIASLIFKSISNEHKDGKLWSNLLSILRLQLKDYNFNDVSCLLNLECHTKRTLSKMLRGGWEVKTAEVSKCQLRIDLHLPNTPEYENKYLPEFQITMHVIFPDFTGIKLKKEVACGEVLKRLNCPKEFSYVVSIPAKATEYAVFMKVTEAEDGVALRYPQSTGMCCVAVGTIDRKQHVPAKKKRVVKKASGNKTKKVHKPSKSKSL